MDGIRTRTKIPLEIVPCNNEIFHLEGSSSNEGLQNLINTLNCLSPESYNKVSLTGNYFAEYFRYIEINLVACWDKPGCDS